MKKGKKYFIPIISVIATITILFSQGDGYLSQKLMVENNIRDRVSLVLEKGQIIIKPLSNPRKGWGKAFQEMSNSGDDRLLFDDVFDDENLEEWK